MPFQSEKQRRYLHANEPELAQQWEKEYGMSNNTESAYAKAIRSGSQSQSPKGKKKSASNQGGASVGGGS